MDLHTPVTTPDDLHAWIKEHLKIHIPRRAVCADHHAPFDYLQHSYFEPAKDIVVWAPRGGGKTRLAAAATVLDLLHKPPLGVRILGGSLQQSLRIWEHLLPDLEELLEPDQILGRSRGRNVRLKNGSHAAAIAQSETAVRGLRIQKLRCDELELFDAAVFDAAKLTTRSIKGTHGTGIAGTIEALSTLHHPWGLMHKYVEESKDAGRKVVKWCLLDVLEKCPPERECASCPLHEDCGGAARQAEGFVPIDDAIRLKARASRESWDAEMLCRRPSVRGAVFPTFDPDAHVRLCEPAGGRMTLGVDFGFANPFACLWIHDDGRAVHVIDEYVQSGRTMEDHIEMIRARKWGDVRHISCDPAGNSRNDQTAESNIKLLRRRGFIVRSTPSKIADGLELIRRGLRSGTGEMSLFVHPRCVNLIRAMRGYHYDPVRPKEAPLKDGEHDHLIDALRYFYINRQSSEELKTSRY